MMLKYESYPNKVNYFLCIKILSTGLMNYKMGIKTCVLKKTLQKMLQTKQFLMPQVSFYTPWKHKKPRRYQMFSGGVKTDQRHEMG